MTVWVELTTHSVPVVGDATGGEKVSLSTRAGPAETSTREARARKQVVEVQLAVLSARRALEHDS